MRYTVIFIFLVFVCACTAFAWSQTPAESHSHKGAAETDVSSGGRATHEHEHDAITDFFFASYFNEPWRLGVGGVNLIWQASGRLIIVYAGMLAALIFAHFISNRMKKKRLSDERGSSK